MQSKKNISENLNQRAYLNSITGFLDFFSKQIVGFFLNPISISILSPYLYGIWKVLSQLNNYMTLSNINVSQTLRVLIARERTVASDQTLKKYFTASIYSNLFFLPFYLILGFLLVYLSPFISGANQEYYYEVRLCMSFLVMSFIIKQIFSVFEAVLRGMNMAYKRIGIRALITVISGVLAISVLYMGFGIKGLAFVNILSVLITGITIWWIVRKNISWFGTTKIDLDSTKYMIKKSGKFMLERFIKLMNKSIDLILLGYFIGPIYVTIYVTSRFLVNASLGMIHKILPSVTPGLGKLIGEKNNKKLYEVRSNMIFLISSFGFVTGSIICLFNKSFISIWISNDQFIGSIETGILVLLGILHVLQELDGSLINMSLKLKAKIKLGSINLIIILICSALLIPLFKINGLLISLLIGRIIISLGYHNILKKIFRKEQTDSHLITVKKLIIYLIFMIPFVYVGHNLLLDNWYKLIIFMIMSFVFVSLLMWFIILDKKQKVFLLELKNKIDFFKLKS